jgi:hypothetical protein
MRVDFEGGRGAMMRGIEKEKGKKNLSEQTSIRLRLVLEEGARVNDEANMTRPRDTRWLAIQLRSRTFYTYTQYGKNDVNCQR